LSEVPSRFPKSLRSDRSGTEERTGVTAEAALADGIGALQAGRSLDASRILNDALRAFVGADAGTKVDLRLAAGLADSNLSSSMPQAATSSSPASAQQQSGSSAARPKAAAAHYLSRLDLINQRRWAEAIGMLSRASSGSMDLRNPVTLGQLNQESAATASTLQSSLTDASRLSRSLVEAQREWAISVAQLGLGRIEDAEAALARSAAYAREPVRAVAPERIVWMRAAIERQKGRIEARKGNVEVSLANFDCAIAALQGGSPTARQLCVFNEGRPLPDTVLNAPLLVEAQLERASIASRDAGRSREAVLRDYGDAVQSLANLTGTGSVSFAALERYFSLLLEAPQSESRDEEYFRAMQSIGEPAIAREYAQLQKVVSADPAVADLLRQRGDLERQLIRLRYEITAASGAGQADLTALETERAATDAKLVEINEKLLAANGIGALEDQPATIASIREALAPGEVFLKLTALRSSIFAAAIGRGQTVLYRLRGQRARSRNARRHGADQCPYRRRGDPSSIRRCRGRKTVQDHCRPGRRPPQGGRPDHPQSGRPASAASAIHPRHGRSLGSGLSAAGDQGRLQQSRLPRSNRRQQYGAFAPRLRPRTQGTAAVQCFSPISGARGECAARACERPGGGSADAVRLLGYVRGLGGSHGRTSTGQRARDTSRGRGARPQRRTRDRRSDLY
jgi:hypothetical protein